MVAVYPRNVLALNMSKPQGFSYKSGQYMFVNCAAMSPFEWYAFEETSVIHFFYMKMFIKRKVINRIPIIYRHVEQIKLRALILVTIMLSMGPNQYTHLSHYFIIIFNFKLHYL